MLSPRISLLAMVRLAANSAAANDLLLAMFVFATAIPCAAIEISSQCQHQILTVTEPARLQMTKLGELEIRCWKGQAFDVQVLADFSEWSTVATLTNTTGALVYTDPDAGTRARRFYRVVAR